MNTLLRTSLILTFTIVSLFAVAQVPKDGAMLQLDPAQIEIMSGGEATVAIEVIRSKRFQKSKIGAPSVASSLKGLTHDIVVTEQPDVYLLTLHAEEGMANGKHTLIINGDRKWGRRIRSTMLTVDIVSQGTTISSKQ